MNSSAEQRNPSARNGKPAQVSPPPTWIANLVARRLNDLQALGLEGTPAREIFPDTYTVWARILARAGAWDRHRDEPRLSAAFDALEECTRWPSPRQFLDAIPGHYAHTDEPARDTLPRELAVKRFADLCAQLQTSAPAAVKRS